MQIIPAIGTGTPVTASSEQVSVVRDWSSDGHTIIVQQQNSTTGMDVLSLPVSEKPEALTPLLNSQFDEILPRLSPDGHLAGLYLERKRARGSVCGAVPGRVGRWQISDNGVTMNVPGVTWSRNGKQIYFRDAAGGLMVVDVQPQGSEFHSGVPRQISRPQAGCGRWMRLRTDEFSWL